jgi:hypothetical protein
MREEKTTKSNFIPQNSQAMPTFKESFVLQSTIISGLFWPNLGPEEFTAPKVMADQMNRFSVEVSHPVLFIWRFFFGVTTLSLLFNFPTFPFLTMCSTNNGKTGNYTGYLIWARWTSVWSWVDMSATLLLLPSR